MLYVVLTAVASYYMFAPAETAAERKFGRKVRLLLASIIIFCIIAMKHA